MTLTPLHPDTAPADQQTSDDSSRVFIARTKMRHALRLVAASKAPTTALPTASQALRAAADLLDQEFDARALATARGEADYDPDAVLYDVLGRRRKGASMPGFWAGREPANKGKKYEPDPPTLDDILLGPFFCVLSGATTGIAQWDPHQVRNCLRKLALKAGVRRRVAPHQFRHAHCRHLRQSAVDCAVRLTYRDPEDGYVSVVRYVVHGIATYGGRWAEMVLAPRYATGLIWP